MMAKQNFMMIKRNLKVYQEKLILNVIKNKQKISTRPYVLKTIFESKKTRKLEFLYLGTRISALIIDKDFFKDLASGKISFMIGTVIKAEMVVVKEWSGMSKTWIYNIILLQKWIVLLIQRFLRITVFMTSSLLFI